MNPQVWMAATGELFVVYEGPIYNRVVLNEDSELHPIISRNELDIFYAAANVWGSCE